MSKRADTQEYRQLFLGDVPLMDVRSPIEFNKGAFATAVNHPLMSDDERHQVGIMYKQEGQDAAIALGNLLVSGDTKEARIKTWKAFAAAHPTGYLYCFRGGLRSRTTQAWMGEVGINYPLVKGGYKAMRRFLIEESERIAQERDFIVIGGRTGNGKTMLIHEMSNTVDLEGLANHRGSSFGRAIDDFQPTQINFENALAVALIKNEAASHKPIFAEDESTRIGRLSLPLPLAHTMRICPIVLVDEQLEVRIDNIQKDYVTDLLSQHVAAFGEQGFELFSGFLLEGLARIKKRLGGATYAEIKTLMDDALDLHQSKQDEVLHRCWIEKLLIKYYDPMYDYQIAKKQQSIIFTGSRAEILQWQKSRS
jgi:tRNA 2-selenouridine synthase